MNVATLTGRILVAGVLALCGAQAWAEKGSGSIAVGFQSNYVNGYVEESGSSRNPIIGNIRMHSIYFAGDYYVTDNLSVSLLVPYVTSKHEGPVAEVLHDPSVLDEPFNHAHPLKEGEYHSTWQDLSIGMRYDTRLRQTYYVSPFITYHAPMRNYPHFGFAAAGYNQERLEFGLDVSQQFALSNFFWSASLSYNVAERFLGVNTDHLRASAMLGYFFTNRLAGRAFVNAKDGKGLEFPDDYLDVGFTGEEWFQHDRLLKHNWAHVGVGVSYAATADYELNLAVQRMVWGEQVNYLDYGVNIEVVRFFGR